MVWYGTVPMCCDTGKILMPGNTVARSVITLQLMTKNWKAQPVLMNLSRFSL